MGTDVKLIVKNTENGNIAIVWPSDFNSYRGVWVVVGMCEADTIDSIYNI